MCRSGMRAILAVHFPSPYLVIELSPHSTGRLLPESRDHDRYPVSEPQRQMPGPVGVLGE